MSHKIILWNGKFRFISSHIFLTDLITQIDVSRRAKPTLVNRIASMKMRHLNPIEIRVQFGKAGDLGGRCLVLRRREEQMFIWTACALLDVDWPDVAGIFEVVRETDALVGGAGYDTSGA